MGFFAAFLVWIAFLILVVVLPFGSARFLKPWIAIVGSLMYWLFGFYLIVVHLWPVMLIAALFVLFVSYRRKSR